MTTKKQIEANRRNAQRSTGPTSGPGIERAKQNSLKHGLCSRALQFVNDEERTAYQARAALPYLLGKSLARTLERLHSVRKHQKEVLEGDGGMNVCSENNNLPKSEHKSGQEENSGQP
jgi:hypothetical protein